MAVERAHLVAGFGEIHGLEADAVLFDTSRSAALAAAEADILAHMNEDHADAVRAIASSAAAKAADWSMTGIDPEGADFRSANASLRVVFEAPVHDAEGARRELVRLTRAAPAAPAAGS
jgi:putative heme iron utilization protein